MVSGKEEQEGNQRNVILQISKNLDQESRCRTMRVGTNGNCKEMQESENTLDNKLYEHY